MAQGEVTVLSYGLFSLLIHICYLTNVLAGALPGWAGSEAPALASKESGWSGR